VSGTVNDWSVFDSSFGSVKPTHENAANNGVHVSGGVTKDKVLVGWSVFFHGGNEILFKCVHVR